MIRMTQHDDDVQCRNLTRTEGPSMSLEPYVFIKLNWNYCILVLIKIRYASGIPQSSKPNMMISFNSIFKLCKMSIAFNLSLILLLFYICPFTFQCRMLGTTVHCFHPSFLDQLATMRLAQRWRSRYLESTGLLFLLFLGCVTKHYILRLLLTETSCFYRLPAYKRVTTDTFVAYSKEIRKLRSKFK